MLPELHIGFSTGRLGGLVTHLLKNFPQFIVIHTEKGFGIVNKAELDVFLTYFLSDQNWHLTFGELGELEL